MPESQIYQTVLTQNLGALSMAIVFIVYLIRKDIGDRKTMDKFNKTINNHLNSALKTEKKLACSLQELSDSIKNLSNKK